MRLASLGALALVSACGSDRVLQSADASAMEATIQPNSCTPHDLTEYDQSCAQDQDCTSVLANSCAQCDCGGGTISTSAIPQYEADRARILRTQDGAAECFCQALSRSCCVAARCTMSCPRLVVLADGGGGSSDANGVPDGSVLCALHSGIIDGGDPSGDPSRWCMPGEQCTTFNGGWACCTTPPNGGMSVCVAPVAGDGGP